MAIILNDNIQANLGKPIENKYLNPLLNTPYSGVTHANTTIIEALRYEGLTVNINNEEYWYETGTGDGDLVVKTGGGASTNVTGATNGVQLINGNVELGGTLTGDTTIVSFTGESFSIGSGNTVAGGNYLGFFAGSSFAFGQNLKSTGGTSIAGGYSSIAGGFSSMAFGIITKAMGNWSHAEGSSTQAIGDGSHAEGGSTIASGSTSHAEGSNTCAAGPNTHAEGSNTAAYGNGSHAEGRWTYATITASHSEGQCTIAGGYASHAGGCGFTTKAICTSGVAAFNHSTNNTSQTVGHGALAPQSAILGGLNHNIESGNLRATIIGGNAIKLTGSNYIDYTAVDNLAIFTTPTDDPNGEILVWDSATKKVGKTTVSSLGGLTGATNGLSTSGNDVILGGALTQNTTIEGGSYSLDFQNLSNSELSVSGNSAVLDLNAKSDGQIVMKSQSGTIVGDTFTNAIGFNLDYNASIFSVTDNRATARGLQYVNDYSLQYDDRSLVDKAYVDAIASGLDAKDASIVATTSSDGNIDISGGTFVSGSTLDGVVVQDTWRVLIKNQTDPIENGIYDYSASASGFTRSADFDGNPTGEVSQGSFTFIVTGDTLSSTSWMVTTPDPITVGTTDINFTIASRSFDLVDGTGTTITIAGSNRSVSVELATASGLDFDAGGTAGRLRVASSIAGLGSTLSSGVINIDSAGTGSETFMQIEDDATNVGLTTGTIGSNMRSSIVTGYDVAAITSDLGEFKVDRCTLANNMNSSIVTGYNVAAITSDLGTFSVDRCTLANNMNSSIVTGYDVAAITSDLGTFKVDRCTLANNMNSSVVTGYDVAAITSDLGTFSVDRCTLANNMNSSIVIGYNVAAITSDLGEFKVDRCTLANNMNSSVVTGYDVAAITSDLGEFKVDRCTLAASMDSSAGSTYTSNAIIADLGTFIIDRDILAKGMSSYAGTPTNSLNAIGYDTTGKLVIDGDVINAAVTGNTLIDAGNGLTKAGNIVILGGTLTGDTQVYTNSYGIAFGSVSSTGADSFATGAYGGSYGDYSFSTGKYARACGTGSFASGIGSFAYSGGSVAFSGGISDATDAMAINSGCATGVGSFAFGGFASGANSFAHGYNSITTGNHAIAMGKGAEANADHAIAIGYGSIAAGDYTAVIGGEDNSIDASVSNAAIIGGTNITLSGATYDFTTAVQKFAIIDAPGADSGGLPLTRNTTTGKIEEFKTLSGLIQTDNGISLNGADKIVLGGTLTGDTTIETSTFGVAIGTSAIASGITSFAIGNNTIAGGNYSFAGGNTGKATGNYSFAFGGQATGNDSVAFGYSTASGNDSVAFGSGQAIGDYSFAEGYSTIASGSYSHAGGYHTRAIGDNSHAGGKGDYNTSNAYIYACGVNSFIHSTNAAAQTVGHGANAPQSVILGGIDHNIESGNTNAAIIGGNAIKLTGSTYVDHTAVDNFAIMSTPAVGTTSDSVLVRNTSTGIVKTVAGSELGDANNVYDITGITSATLTTAEYVVLVQTSGATQTVTLPASPVNGQAYKIKDQGNALTNAITVSGNGNNIDGAANATINTDYGALELVYSLSDDEWYTLAFIN